ncbi:MAG: hypothetical protein HOK67_03345, partial [Deltaproteobacteria bacterium]|nr:hypothetical protein [Deltaproteobacteria bacterium]
CKKDIPEEASDLTAPTLKRINLADNCLDVGVTSSLYILFSEEMDTSTVTTNIESTSCSGNVQLSADNFASCVQMLNNPQPDTDKKAFTVFPSSSLSDNTTYKVKLTAGLRDKAGNHMASEYALSNGFTTETQSVSGLTYWTKQIGTGQDDYTKGIVLDSSNGFYITGRTESSFTTDSNNGAWDIFLVKLDSSGITDWKRQAGTSNNDYAEAVVVDSSNDVYIAGKTEGTLESGITRASDTSSDIILIKYDSTGDSKWQKQLGSSKNDWAFAVAADSQNNIYVTGKTEGALTGSNLGGSDIFLAKYDKNGGHLWTRQTGTSTDESAYGIVIDSNNNIYITGHTQGRIGTMPHKGKRDIFVIKLNTSGEITWSRQIGSDQDDYARGIALDVFGNILVTGYSYGDFVTTNLGDSDLVLFKMDTDGDLLWWKQMGTDLKEQGKSVLVDGNGDVFVAGLTYGSMNCRSNLGFSDFILVKFDFSGAQQWVKQYGSVGLDYGKGLVLNSDDELLFAGSTGGSIDGNISKGKTDLLVFKYDRNGNRQ